MTITCMGCGERNFTVNPADVEQIGIITFICEMCGKTTGVQRHDGGGICVSIEDRTKWPKEKDKDKKV